MRGLQAFWAAGFALLFQSAMVGAAPAEYPIRVFVVQNTGNLNSSAGISTGLGRGNIQEGNLVTGFDYAYSCGSLYPLASSGDPFNPLTGYQGRWKKQGTRLAILIVEIGNPKHQSECELKTTLVDRIYSMSAGQPVTYTRQQYDEAMAWRKASAAMTHPADADPAHFPLRVVILETQWQNHSGGGVTGEGRGNVHNGDSATAFTFDAPRCLGSLSAVGPRNSYPGKWLAESSRLLVLTHKFGAAPEDGLSVCELETKVQPDNVLFKIASSGLIQTLTQDQYKARIQAARSAQQSSAPDAAKAEASTAVGPSEKLSITSSPDGADIEIDGAFVGSTPSVIDLGLGEHSVIIRKQGYKPWERKLRLVGGNVKLNADLERR